MKIYLIRHGRQCSPLCNVDVALAPEGIRQAKLLAVRLKESVRVDAVCSSSLLRAVQTADILGEALGVQPRPGDARLNEIDFGELTGLSDQQIQERYGAFMERRRNLEADLPFPGGECGRQVFERAYPCLLELAQSGPENVIAVTHGGTIRSLVAGVLGLEQRCRLAIARTLENCSLTVLEYSPARRRFTVETVNDYAHLSAHPELLRSAIVR
ncbi:MAG: histidine phosphatase family protein [Lachnospiraceae bacterium]|nr:histidine phosphatase family protein [Lachnospiraceae bacterium]